MAVYEYECRKCGTVEVTHPMSSPAFDKCTVCGTDGFKRLIAGPSEFLLKGTGWGRDLYAKSPADK